MIETVHIRNYKVLREVDLRLQPLTLIVGPNASGKSTILEALDLALRVFRLEETPAEILRNHLFTRAATGDLLLELRSRYLGKVMELECGIRRDRERSAFREERWLEGEPDFGAFPWRLLMARSAVKVRFEFEKLASPSVPKQPELALPSDGQGLPSILAGLYLEYPERFKDLVARLREVIPVVENVRLRRRSTDGLMADELLFDMKSGQGIPAALVSHGTLLTVGLLTVLAAPLPPQLLLVDDLESGLHPKALGDLVQQLRKIQEQDPQLQIVATSHSPYLLDYLQAEEILLTSLDENGYAVVKPLTAHPEYERWKDLMAPGEFWSTVGEKWVTEPQKSRLAAG